jgi:hypothetical protein
VLKKLAAGDNALFGSLATHSDVSSSVLPARMLAAGPKTCQCTKEVLLGLAPKLADRLHQSPFSGALGPHPSQKGKGFGDRHRKKSMATRKILDKREAGVYL